MKNISVILAIVALAIIPNLIFAQENFYCATKDSTIQKAFPVLTPVFANFKDFIPWNNGGGGQST